MPGPVAVPGFEPLLLSIGDGAPLPAALFGVASPPQGPLAYAQAPWLVDVPASSSALAAVAASGGAAAKKGASSSSFATAPSTASMLVTSHSNDVSRGVEDESGHVWASTSSANSGGVLGAQSREWTNEWAECQDLGRASSSANNSSDNTKAADAAASPAEEGEKAKEAETKAQSDADSAVFRSRFANKILADFVDAAAAGAIGAISGAIMPLNPVDSPLNWAWHHNNIFFSTAPDVASRARQYAQAQKAKKKSSAVKSAGETPDVNAYIAALASGSAGGAGSAVAADAFADTASLVSAGLELRASGAIAAADVPGLHTMATVIIDYGGARMVASSPIPGVMSREWHRLVFFSCVSILPATAMLLHSMWVF